VPVHGSHLFHPADVLFGYGFADLIGPDPSGHPSVDFRRIDEVERLDDSTAAPGQRGE
jgi:hypothetical protein